MSGACQVYCCFKLACDVTDFEDFEQTTLVIRALFPLHCSHRRRTRRPCWGKIPCPPSPGHRVGRNSNVEMSVTILTVFVLPGITACISAITNSSAPFDLIIEHSLL
jgi:hypothetical protein